MAVDLDRTRCAGGRRVPLDPVVQGQNKLAPEAVLAPLAEYGEPAEFIVPAAFRCADRADGFEGGCEAQEEVGGGCVKAVRSDGVKDRKVSHRDVERWARHSTRLFRSREETLARDGKRRCEHRSTVAGVRRVPTRPLRVPAQFRAR